MEKIIDNKLDFFLYNIVWYPCICSISIIMRYFYKGTYCYLNFLFHIQTYFNWSNASGLQLVSNFFLGLKCLHFTFVAFSLIWFNGHNKCLLFFVVIVLLSTNLFFNHLIFHRIRNHLLLFCLPNNTPFKYTYFSACKSNTYSV